MVPLSYNNSSPRESWPRQAAKCFRIHKRQDKEGVILDLRWLEVHSRHLVRCGVVNSIYSDDLVL